MNLFCRNAGVGALSVVLDRDGGLLALRLALFGAIGV
jgi:hypothetical protein